MDLAESAARRAGRFIGSVARPSDPQSWSLKGTSDFVTEVDREAERLISEELLAAVPDSRVMGEELSPEASLEGLTWIVDPLDGTTNFLHGFPRYAVSIAVAQGHDLVGGVVLDVTADRLYRAATGHGATADGVPLAVSAIVDPGSSLIATGFPFKHLPRMEQYQEQFSAILRTTSGIRRAGAAALDLADVAAGVFEGFWELSLAPWDIAAGVVLVREAGGLVTDLLGNPVGLDHSEVVAGSPPVHRWLLEVLNQTPATSRAESRP